MQPRPNVIIGWAAALALAACSKAPDAAKPQGPPPPTEVDAVVMAKAPLSKHTEVNGSIIASEHAQLRPEVAGRLVFLDVREGSAVQEGATIARLFNDDLQATLSRHKAQLALAEATLARLNGLLSVEGVNKQEVDQAQAQVASVKADIAFTEAQIRKTIITAPFSGTLGLRQVSPGAYVTPQDVICSIQQAGILKVDFNVPEHLATLVQTGDTVLVMPAASAQSHKARITAIEPLINATTRNLKVRAILPATPGLSPGSFARVRLDAGSSQQALLLPTQAIVPDTRHKRVFVIKAGKAESVIVQTGQRGTATVEVTEGLQAGDTVAVTGVLYLRPGAPAKVRNVLPTPAQEAP